MQGKESPLVARRLHPDYQREAISPPAELGIHPRAHIRLPSSLCKPSLRTYFDWDDSGNDNYTKRPKLLDLFAGGGGSAMGYYLAGFQIVGVDIAPQTRYPFTFIQADALQYVAEHGREYDAIHASPPCQYYSRLRHLPWLRDRVYWRSIPPTREALKATGIPYVIENVEDAVWDMVTPAIICGYSLGLPLFRHRCFETGQFSTLQPGHPKHDRVIVSGGASLSARHHGGRGFKGINRDSIAGHGNFKGDTERWRISMEIDWMTAKELSQAIPPAYCRFVGTQLRTYLEATRQDALDRNSVVAKTATTEFASKKETT